MSKPKRRGGSKSKKKPSSSGKYKDRMMVAGRYKTK